MNLEDEFGEFIKRKKEYHIIATTCPILSRHNDGDGEIKIIRTNKDINVVCPYSYGSQCSAERRNRSESYIDCEFKKD